MKFIESLLGDFDVLYANRLLSRVILVSAAQGDELFSKKEQFYFTSEVICLCRR